MQSPWPIALITILSFSFSKFYSIEKPSQPSLRSIFRPNVAKGWARLALKFSRQFRGIVTFDDFTVDSLYYPIPFLSLEILYHATFATISSTVKRLLVKLSVSVQSIVVRHHEEPTKFIGFVATTKLRSTYFRDSTLKQEFEYGPRWWGEIRGCFLPTR